MENNDIKISRIAINGFKRIIQFSIAPDGKSVEISGSNGKGKSSIIDAIWVALTGKDVPDVSINRQSVKSDIMIDLTNGHTVTWSMSAKSGKKLVVEGPDGKVAAPVKYLENMIGEISFDPFEFCELTPADQRAALVKLLRLDFTDLEMAKRKALDQKAHAASTKRLLESQIDQLGDAKETEHIDVDALKERKKLRDEAVDVAEKYRKGIASIQGEIDILEGTIEARKEAFADAEKALQAEISRLEEEIANRKAAFETKKDTFQLDVSSLESKRDESLERLVAGHEYLKDADAAVESIADPTEELIQASETNAMADRWERRLELVKRYEEAEASLIEAEAASKKADQDRLDRLKNAEFPVEGLEFSDSGVLFNGLPFNRRNQAMSDIIKVGVAMSIAQNPALRIARIKDASLLDAEGMKNMLAILSAHGFQAFIEVVGDNQELTALTIEEVE